MAYSGVLYPQDYLYLTDPTNHNVYKMDVPASICSGITIPIHKFDTTQVCKTYGYYYKEESSYGPWSCQSPITPMLWYWDVQRILPNVRLTSSTLTVTAAPYKFTAPFGESVAPPIDSLIGGSGTIWFQKCVIVESPNFGGGPDDYANNVTLGAITPNTIYHSFTITGNTNGQITFDPPLDLGEYSTYLWNLPYYTCDHRNIGAKCYVISSYQFAPYAKPYKLAVQNPRGTKYSTQVSMTQVDSDTFSFLNVSSGIGTFSNKYTYGSMGSNNVAGTPYGLRQLTRVLTSSFVDANYACYPELNKVLDQSNSFFLDIYNEAGDSLVLTDENWVSLTNSGVIESTIVVKNSTETVTYVLNTDYAILSGGPSTPPQISRKSTGSIPNGATVIVIYQHPYVDYNPTGISSGGFNYTGPHPWHYTYWDKWLCSSNKYKVSRISWNYVYESAPRRFVIKRGWDFDFGSASTYAPLDIVLSCRFQNECSERECFWITCTDKKVRYVCFITPSSVKQSCIIKSNSGRLLAVYSK